jgi:hypothetical protein
MRFCVVSGNYKVVIVILLIIDNCNNWGINFLLSIIHNKKVLILDQKGINSCLSCYYK